MTSPYIMEDPLEADRLDAKTDPEEIRKQALWCGIQPGMRLLDVGCGTGKTSAILYDMIQPGGSVTGIDASEDRIRRASAACVNRPGLAFHVRDIRRPLEDLGTFDAIWMRFVLEYFRAESPAIVQRLSPLLATGGLMCLLDKDQNWTGMHELPEPIRRRIPDITGQMEERMNFDPYAGRRLYAHLYDLGYEGIEATVMGHHVIYGPIRDQDAFNWSRKIRMLSDLLNDEWDAYPGGKDAFVRDFEEFLRNPRRFIYSALVLCKGRKP